MSEQDPKTNGGLPPKISLKPRVSEDEKQKAPNTADAPATAAESNVTSGPKPITLRKPVPVEIKKPAAPVPPTGPKPITIKQPASEASSEPRPSPPPPPPVARASAEPEEPSMAERALAEAKAEQGQSPASPPPPQAPEAKPAAPQPAPDTTADATATKPQPPEAKPTETAQPEQAADKSAPLRPTLSKPSPDGAPKRPVLRPAGSGANTIKRPAPVGIRKDGPDPLAAPGTKKSTSRITLPSTTEKSTSGQIKTIKIAPKSQTGKTESQTEAADADAGKPTIDPKRQTSRISLESVLGGGNQSPNAPATIKIKRAAPSTAEAKTAASQTGPVEPEEPTTDTPSSGATPEATPESQKKTLKVKRPAVGSGERPTAGGTSPMFTPPVATAKVGEPEPHWAFSIVALAATIVAGVLIYVLAAQIMDVDQAEGPPGDGLPWPARFSP